MPDARPTVTLLHVSDMQFGRHHRFGRLAPLAPDAEFDTLIQRLRDDLLFLRRDYRLTPDIAVISGDLAEWGLPREFDDAARFLEGLAAVLQLGRDRVLIVPGNHDVNRHHCNAHFSEAVGDGNAPTPPFWPKWRSFASMFSTFYHDLPYRFTEETPWTWYELSDLKVVVAGLNSTIAEIHDLAPDDPLYESLVGSGSYGHFGWVGEEQLRWFSERLARAKDEGLLRIGVVHHNVHRGAVADDESLRDVDTLNYRLGDLLNLLLHGHTHEGRVGWSHPKLPVFSTGSAALTRQVLPDDVPNQYQIIQVSAECITHWTRCFDPRNHRWIGDTRCSANGTEWYRSYPVTLDSVQATFPQPPSDAHAPIALSATRSTDQPRRKPNNIPPSLGGLFTGRADLISELRSHLSAATEVRTTAITQPQTLCGLGGVGKTRLAIEYAWHFVSHYDALFFVQADSPENVSTNLARLVDLLPPGLITAEAPTDDARLRVVLDWLANNPRWLLILDNVDTSDAAAAVRAHLRTISSASGHVLITSRLTTWPAGFTRVPLDVLSPAESVSLLLTRTDGRSKGVTDDADAADIARDLGGLALALELAGAYINAAGCSLSEYRDRWRAEDRAVRDWYDPDATDYPRDIAATWAITTDKLSTQARGLLELLAYYAPDPIPRRVFTDDTTLRAFAAAGIGDPLAALSELLKFSMVAHDRGEPPGIRVHRLVQAVTRGGIREQQRGKSIEAALATINAAFTGDPEEFRLWPTLEPIAPHAIEIAYRSDRRSIADPTAGLMRRLGVLHYRKANFLTAEPLFKRFLEITEGHRGIQHPDFALALNDLALTYRAMNRVKEALPLLRRSVQITEELLGPEHTDVAIRIGNLGNALQELNELEEAEVLLRRALQIQEKALGPRHRLLAMAASNLGNLLSATGRRDEAMRLAEWAVEISREVDGTDDPLFGRHLGNYALLLVDHRPADEIETLLRQSLVILEAAFGPDHPDVGEAVGRIGAILRDKRRFADAEPYLWQSLQTFERAYGPSHRKVASALNNLATLFFESGKVAEAIPLLRRAVAITEATHGSVHPDLATHLGNLARSLSRAKYLEEAESLQRRAVSVSEKANGAAHPHTGYQWGGLAWILFKRGRAMEAEPIMRKWVETIRDAKALGSRSVQGWEEAKKGYFTLLTRMRLPPKEIDRRMRDATGEPL